MKNAFFLVTIFGGVRFQNLEKSKFWELPKEGEIGRAEK